MQKIKRFYKVAEAGSTEEGYAILLDGRPVRTPARALLAVTSPALAEAIAREWQGQGEEVESATMPLNNLACTAIDIVGPRRVEIVDDLVGYGGHDLICYWSDETGELLDRQQQHWQPLLDWAAQDIGASLVKTCGVISQDQPGVALAALKSEIEAHDDMCLTGLAAVVQATGSLILGLGLSHGRLNSEQAFALSQLDESYQQERWGEDAEASARRDALRQDIVSAGRFLGLLREAPQDNTG